MPYFYVRGSGTRVTLTDKDFIAKGGEASVYAKGGTAYRVYHNPSNAIPAQKIKELSAIGIPEVVSPVSELLDSKKERCGETLPFVDNSWVLCQLFTNSFRRKNGIDNQHITAITDSMLEVVPHCHRKGVVLVDPNETNWLVPHSLDTVRLIDVSCCQTPSFPGTAIKLAIQDQHTKGFTKESDYFSLAVVLSWLWVGIHPYLAFNKSWEHMDANSAMLPRMKANASFFAAGTEFNRACRPLAEIPAGLSAWLRAVLQDGKRLAPPLHAGDAVASVAITAAPASTGSIVIEKVLTSRKDIVGVFGDAITVAAGVVVGYTPLGNMEITAEIKNGAMTLKTSDGKLLNFSCASQYLFESEGRIYAVDSGYVSEVVFNEFGTSIRATVTHVGSVADLPTTKIYPGCVIQNILGRYLVSIFPKSGHCVQHQLRDLEGWQILDAKYERGVLCVMAESGGKYRLWCYRIDGSEVEGEILSTDFGDVNFAVTSNGVCALLDAAGTLHAFRNKPKSPRKKIPSFPAPDMQLFSRGAHVVGAIGKTLYRVILS